jgi:hypothetical protein
LVEPQIAGRALLIATKAVVAAFMKMQFDRSARLLPALDQAEALLAKHGIVGSERGEHRLWARWRRDGQHEAINGRNEIGTRVCRVCESRRHRCHGSRRKSKHPDRIRIDAPFGGVSADHPVCGLRVGAGGLNPYRHRLGEFVLAVGSFFHPVFEDGWQIAGGSYAFALGTSAESLAPLTNVKIAARKWGP